MSQTDDLIAAIASLSGAVSILTGNITANDATIQAELKALVAAQQSGDPAAIQTAITNIGNLSASVAAASQAIASETSTLTASLQPPVVVPTTTPAPTA